MNVPEIKPLVEPWKGHAGRIHSIEAVGNGWVTCSVDGYAKQWAAEGAPGFVCHHGAIVNSVTHIVGRVLSAGADGRLLMWDDSDGTLLRPLHEHSDAINEVIGTRDNRAVTASADKTLRVWNLRDGSSVPLQGHKTFVNHGSISCATGALGTVDAKGALAVWNLARPSDVPQWFKADGHWGTAVHLHRRFAYVGYGDGMLRAWRLDGTEPTPVAFQAHGGPVNRIWHTTTLGADTVVSCALDGTLALWDVRKGRKTSWSVYEDDGIRGFEIDAHDRVYCACEDGTIGVFDLKTGTLIARLVGHSCAVNAVKLAAGARRLLSGSDAGEIVVWDLDSIDVATESTTGYPRTRTADPVISAAPQLGTAGSTAVGSHAVGRVVSPSQQVNGSRERLPTPIKVNDRAHDSQELLFRVAFLHFESRIKRAPDDEWDKDLDQEKAAVTALHNLLMNSNHYASQRTVLLVWLWQCVYAGAVERFSTKIMCDSEIHKRLVESSVLTCKDLQTFPYKHNTFDQCLRRLRTFLETDLPLVVEALKLNRY